MQKSTITDDRYDHDKTFRENFEDHHATNTLTETEQGPPISNPLVHTLETPVRSCDSRSYRDFRKSFCLEEAEAVEDVYFHIDAAGDTNYLPRLFDCRSHAYFHRHDETGEVKVISSCCRLRWCPFCSEGRKYRIQETVKDWIDTISRPKFLTLTVKHNDDPLEDQIQHLYSSFRKFRLGAFFRSKVQGGIWFFQIKKSKTDGLWHPHLHCLLDAFFMDRKYLSKLWLDITGDSMVIDIRGVKDVNNVADYVARYAAKPSVLSGMDVCGGVELVTALHGRRLVGTWGNAKHLSFRIQKNEDAKSWRKLESFELIKARYELDPTAKLIYDCWMQNRPLPKEAIVIKRKPLSDDHYIKKRMQGADCYGQCFLFRFK